MDFQNNEKIRMLYELNAKYAQLDYVTQGAERQLASVNKRLNGLWHDLAVYAGMLIVPPLIFLLLNNNTASLLLALVMLFRNIMVCIYVFSLPFTVYHLIKATVVLTLNSEQKTEFSQPLQAGALRGAKPERERTFRTEQKKLVYVLSRYYLYKDQLDQIRKELESDSCTLTLPELKTQMMKLSFFEDIRPADSNVLWKQWLKSYISPQFIILVIIIGLVIAYVIFWYICQLVSWGTTAALWERLDKY